MEPDAFGHHDVKSRVDTAALIRAVVDLMNTLPPSAGCVTVPSDLETTTMLELHFNALTVISRTNPPVSEEPQPSAICMLKI